MRHLPLFAAALMLTTGTTASADTLREALEQAYATNPSLTGARSGQRAVDEGVAEAKSQGRPTIIGQGSLSQTFTGVGTFGNGGRVLSGGVELGVPIFQGGRVRNAIGAAEARVMAGRADLRSTEAAVFAEVVAAYMDVIRDESIVRLNGGQVRVLDTNLQASRDRFEVGDVTRTDVAQSEARLALARSSLDSAQAQLTASRENYRRVVGELPEALEPPPTLPSLPGTAGQAVDIAIASNPQLVAAREAQEAARRDVGVARGERLPTLAAVTGADYVDYLGTLDDLVGVPGGGGGGGGAPIFSLEDSQTTSRVGLTARVPIYQGGGPGARIRAAQARQSQAIENSIFVERDVVAQANSAFARWTAARAVIGSSRIAVDANRLALEGTRAENSVGTRNVLDVLNAEQELLNSQVQLVSAERDEYVAGFTLLAAMGRAEARDLGLDGGALYDPALNYERVRNRISDWSDDPAPVARATHTAPQNTGVTSRPN
jgi:outer membrane protein